MFDFLLPNMTHDDASKGGILFLIYLGKFSFSGEVGGYPQALLKVVNLQGMLNFHRNFHWSKGIKSRIRVGGGNLEYACSYMYRTQAETKMTGGHRKKR